VSIYFKLIILLQTFSKLQDNTFTLQTTQNMVTNI